MNAEPRICRSVLLFGELNVPCAFNASFDALIRWTFVRVCRQGAVHFVPTARRDPEFVMKANPGDLQHTVDILDITVNIRH